jgi:glutamyl-tRNA reductase
MGQLLLVGLNHLTAPLAVRERLAFDAGQQRAALESFKQRFAGCEAVLLSTCNRVELYVASATEQPAPMVDELIRFVAQLRDVPAEQFRSHVYEKSERSAIEHLFNVATSLDSMVLGESQILGQVRQAYELARDAGAVGAALNPLFQRAGAVGREVMSQTALGDGRVSIAGVAVACAQRIFETFTDKCVLCIGAGKMSALVLQHFIGLRPKRLLICNRDLDKARGLSARFNGEAVDFASLDQHLARSDIIITSTGSPHPIITRPQIDSVLKHRRYRAMFLIDIAVPRDVEPAVGENEHIYLYNIDDLQSVVSATQAQRTDAIEAARAIVARHVNEFLVLQRRRALGPAIELLYQRSHALARQELTRTVSKLPHLSDSERAQLEELARRIVNKLLHDPVSALEQADAQQQHALTPQYLHAIEKLFRLDQDISASDE